jgi:hypothetical protein
MVLKAASSSGDAHPTSAEVFAAARGVASKSLYDALADTDQGVYAIVVHGNFVVNGPGPGGPPPTGHVMTIVWDPTTNHVTDFGVGDREPTTTSLGGGIALDLNGN